MQIRTCVACGRKDSKKNLTRYIWLEDQPVVDESGKSPGRGAYSCPLKKCQDRFYLQRKKWKRLFRLY